MAYNDENIGQKIVSITFDNEEFKKNIEDSMEYLTKMEKSIETFEKNVNEMSSKISDSMKTVSFAEKIEDGMDRINRSIRTIFANKAFDVLSENLDNISYKFTVLGKASLDTFSGIVQRAMEAGISISKSLSIDNVFAGLSQYNNKNNAMRTIVNSLSGADASIEKVNKQLEDLVIFTDETSYNFQDMITNMGRFTSAGVQLEDAAHAMMGIANWSAFVGKNAYEASRAYDVMARSIGQGYMNWMQFQSLASANFMDVNSRKAFIKAAEDAKMITKVSDNLYKTKKGTQFTTETLETTLNEKWLTTDVISKALGSYSTYAETVIGYSKETGKSVSDVLEIFEKEGVNKLFDEFSIKAFKSAQEAKTFSEALDSVRVAAGAQFTKTFEILFGTVDDAKTMWTNLANTLWDIFIPPIQEFNSFLASVKDLGAIQNVINSIKNVFGSLLIILNNIKGAFDNIFPPKSPLFITNLTEKLKNFTRQLVLSKEDTEKFKKIFETVFLFFKKFLELIGSLTKAVSPLVNVLLRKLFDLIYSVSVAVKTILETIHFDEILNGISVAIKGISDTISSFVVPVPDMSGFDEFSKKIQVPFKIIKDVVKGLGSMLVKLKDFLSGIFNNVFKNGIIPGLNDILLFIRNVLLTKLLVDFSIFFNNFLRNANGALLKLNMILSNFAKGIIKFVRDVDNAGMVDSLFTFSAGILMLALAIRILSSDKNTDTARIIAISGALLTLLAAAVRWASFYTINGKDISQKGKMFSNSLGKFLDSLKKGTVDGKTIFGNLGKMLSVGGMAVARGVQDIIFNLTNTIDQYLQKKALANMIIAFSVAILALTFSLHKLASMKPEQFKNIGKALGSLAGIAIILAIAVTFLTQAKNFLDNSTKKKKNIFDSFGNAAELMSMSVAMIALAGAVAIITNSFIKLSSLNLPQIGKGFLALVAIIIVLAGAIKFLSTTLISHSKKTDKTKKGLSSFLEEWNKKSNLLSISVTMMALAGSISMLTNSLIKLSSLKWEQIRNGGVAIVAMIFALALAIKFLSTTLLDHSKKTDKTKDGITSFIEKWDKKSNLLSMSVAMIALAGSVALLTNSFIKLSELNWQQLAQGFIGLALAVAILVGAMKILSTTNEASGGGGGILDWLGGAFTLVQRLALPITIITLAGAIYLLCQALIQLSNLDFMTKILPSLGAIAGIAAILAGTLIIISNFATNIPAILSFTVALLGAAAAMIIMGGALVLISGSLALLASLDVGKLIISSIVLLGTLAVALIAIGSAAPLTLAAAGAVALLGAGLLLLGGGVLLAATGISILVDALTRLLQTLADIIYGGFEVILSLFGVKLPKTMESSGKNTMKGLEKGIDSERNNLKNQMKSVAKDDIQGTYSKEMNQHSPSKVFEENGQFLMIGLANGIESKRKVITDLISKIANSDILKKFRDIMGIHSPGKEPEKDGEHVTEGYGVGIEKKSGVIDKATTLITDKITDGFANSGVIENVKSSGENVITEFSGGMKEAIGTEMPGIASTFSTTFSDEMYKTVPGMKDIGSNIGKSITKGAEEENAGEKITFKIAQELNDTKQIEDAAYRLGEMIGEGIGKGFKKNEILDEEAFNKYKEFLDLSGTKYHKSEQYDPRNNTWDSWYTIDEDFDPNSIHKSLEGKSVKIETTEYGRRLIAKGQGKEFTSGEELSSDDFNKYFKFIKKMGIDYEEFQEDVPVVVAKAGESVSDSIDNMNNNTILGKIGKGLSLLLPGSKSNNKNTYDTRKVTKYRIKSDFKFATKEEYDSLIEEYNRILEEEEDAEELLNGYTSAEDYANKKLAESKKIYNKAKDKKNDTQNDTQKKYEENINKDYKNKNYTVETAKEVQYMTDMYKKLGDTEADAMNKANKNTLEYYESLLKVAKQQDENYDKNLTHAQALAKVAIEERKSINSSLQQTYNSNEFGFNSVEITEPKTDYATAKANIKKQTEKINSFVIGFERLAKAGLSVDLANVIEQEGYWNSSTYAMLNQMSDSEIKKYQDAIATAKQNFKIAQEKIANTQLAISVNSHQVDVKTKAKEEIDKNLEINRKTFEEQIKAGLISKEEAERLLNEARTNAYKTLGINPDGTMTIDGGTNNKEVIKANTSSKTTVQGSSLTQSGSGKTLDKAVTIETDQKADADPNKDERNKIENSSLYNTIEGWVEDANIDIEDKEVKKLMRQAARKGLDEEYKVQEWFEQHNYPWEENEIPDDNETESTYSTIEKQNDNNNYSSGTIYASDKQGSKKTQAKISDEAKQESEAIGSTVVQGMGSTLQEEGPSMIENVMNASEPVVIDSMIKMLNDLLQNAEFLEICKQIGNAISAGISVGMKEGKEGAEETAADVARDSVEAMGPAAGVASPSKITAKVGKYIAEGLALGIRENSFLGTDAAYEMAATTTDTFRNAFDNIDSMVSDEMNNDWSITPVINMDNIEDANKDIKKIFTNHDLEMIASNKQLQNEGKNSQQNTNANQPATYTITQNNYSPKALSRGEIYRQTKNLFSSLSNK